jgi:alcohol dehydrogenase
LSEYWQFHLPTRIVSGAGVLQDLEKEILATGNSRVFLITDKSIEEAGIVEKVTASLKSLKPVGIFNEVTPNSEVSQVERGAALAREAGADYLLAVGGGSCIDTAKALNLVFSLGGKLLDYEGFGQITQPLAPLAAIPTTAGTGSEVTQYSIILDSERHAKLTFLSPYLVPTLALLDPELTLSLPPGLTASTGMDALGHAMESYVSTSSSPLARGLAVEACDLIFKSLVKAVRQGRDVEARMTMLLASNLAGIAFSNSMVGCVHAMAHALGGTHNIPHAVAVGLLLPHGILFNGEGNLLYADLSAKLFGSRGDEPAAVLSVKVSQLLADCDLPRRLSQLGITIDDLPAVAEDAAVDGALFTNPREADADDLLKILKSAL